MCVLHFLCIYIPMYPYSLMRGNLIFCDRFVAELPSYSAHTSSDTYLVSEALVRPLSNVSSSVYYCHWKTTLVSFSVRTFIGSLFLPKHGGFFQKTCRNSSFNFYPPVRICLKLVNSFKSYSIKHGQAQIAITETKKYMFVSGTLYSTLRNLYLLPLSCVFRI